MFRKKVLLIRCLVTRFIIGGIAGLLVSVPVMAQKGVLEEVIVTAQKREQSLSKVGISITAFTGEQVHELGFTNTVDIVEMTPGLNYTVPNAEGSQINFFLRGVGLNDFEDVNENPVGAYFDEVYRGAMGGLDLQMFDMERVEVLRGPQGTLYGRNTTGGLIHFISKKPTDEFGGYGEVSGGSYDQIKFEGAVNGAITDELLGRLSIATNNDNGYTKNRIPGIGNFNETNSQAARGQLLWKPSDKFQILTNLHWSWNHGQVGAWQHQTSVATEPGVFDPVAGTYVGDNRRTVGPTEDLFGTGPGNDAFGYSDTDGDPHAGDYDRNGKVKVKADGASAKVTWNLNDNLTVVNIGAYDHTNRIQEEDTDAGPFPLLEPTFNAGTKQYTEELRLHGDYDRWRWVTGFYYYNQKVDGHYTLDLTNLGFVYFDANFNQDVDSWAIFGQGEYDLTPELTLIAGLRYTEETKTIDYHNVDTTGLYASLTDLGVIPLDASRPNPDDAFLFNRQSVGNLAEHNNSYLTGKAELDWRPSDDLMLYASFSRGVKSAGFNTGFLDETYIFASNTVNTIPFKKETLDAYELGFKSSWMDRKVRLNGAAFYYDYMDFQTFRFELLNAIIFNTDAEVYGGELELQASPWEGWDFALGVSLLHARAKDIPASFSGVPHDRHMVAAPDVTLNGLARYEWPAFGGTAAVLAKFHYQDKTYFDIQNYNNAKENGYVIGDIRGQWTSPDEHWQLAAFVNNVWDEEYITYTFDFALFGFNQVAYGKPRWFGGSVRYNF